MMHFLITIITPSFQNFIFQLFKIQELNSNLRLIFRNLLNFIMNLLKFKRFIINFLISRFLIFVLVYQFKFLTINFQVQDFAFSHHFILMIYIMSFLNINLSIKGD